MSLADSYSPDTYRPLGSYAVFVAAFQRARVADFLNMAWTKGQQATTSE